MTLNPAHTVRLAVLTTLLALPLTLPLTQDSNQHAEAAKHCVILQHIGVGPTELPTATYCVPA